MTKFLRDIAVLYLGTFAVTAHADYPQYYYPRNNYYYPQNSYSRSPNDSVRNDGVDFFTSSSMGPFFRAEIGPSFFEDSRLTRYGVSADDRVKFDLGGTAGAAAGFAFNQYISSDFEIGVIGAKLDSIKYFFTRNSCLYDVPFLVDVRAAVPMQDGCIIPYFGAGIGSAAMVLDADNLSTPGSPTIDGSEADLVLVGQIFAGVRLRLNSSMWLGAGYKFFTSGDPEWNYPNHFKVGMKGITTHSMMLTFFWKF